MSNGRKLIDLRAGKQRLERKKYAALSLAAYDKLDRDALREQEQRRAEVERAARRRF